MQTETEVEIHHIGVQESHKSSISITNELSQQRGIEVMMVSQGNLVENLFVNEFEAVQNEMEVEPDGKQASIGHTVKEEQLKRPQENLNTKDKESSPNHSKYHAHNQPREMVTVKRRQVSIKGSESDEKKHEYYNIVHLPDSVNINPPNTMTVQVGMKFLHLALTWKANSSATV